MIDVSQWRASIGLWYCCQAASGRPANGRHSHSFNAAVDNKSGSTTSGEKTSKLPAALSLIGFFLLLFHYLSLLRHILMIPLTGNCYQVQCTTGVTVTDTNYFHLPGGSISNLIHNDLYLIVCLRMLLLLSGDVELNPGPIRGKMLRIWNWACIRIIKFLQSVWIQIKNIFHPKQNVQLETPSHEPTLTQPEDIMNDIETPVHLPNNTINNETHLQIHQCNTDAPTSTVPAVPTLPPSVSVMNKSTTPAPTKVPDSINGKPIAEEKKGSNHNTSGLIKEHTTMNDMSVIDGSSHTDISEGNPKDIFRHSTDKLAHAISVNIFNVTESLYAKELIPQQTKEEMYVLGVTDKEKASKLLNVIEQQLESSLNPEQYLIDVCHVLINQQHRTLTDIATSILQQLGYSMPDVVTFDSSLPNDVQGFVDNMRQHYKHQPIVATDWPPRIGKDYFGRLALVEKQIVDFSTDVAKSAWHMLRGQIDKIYKLTETKMISIEDLLQPTDSSLPLRIVIDGPPGIGKTTLCLKLLNMWSNGTFAHQQYDLVLYCPLRNSKIATATTLADLFQYKSCKVSKVVDWLLDREGKGLLIIFDGWDELSEQIRQSSLAASIFHRNQLDLSLCSVIVTSRSYASSSLLELPNLSRHVQVIGFSEEEISTVIIQKIQKDPKVAQDILKYLQCKEKSGNDSQYKNGEVQLPVDKDSQLAVKLVRDLEVRNDVRSLCYMPLVCSMVILVYRKEGGHLPTTLTQLYENFILQTIRRHVKKHEINPHTLDSLSSLPSQLAKPLQEMCQLAYTSLANTRMTFSSHQVQSLSEAVKEKYLGLLTAFIEYDEVKYQFIHLSLQEFLAAWWIAKYAEKTEKVFKDHFDDDHFRMCLRFVAGLTHLEHESYQQYFNIQQLDLQCKNVFQNPQITCVHTMNDFHMRSDRTKNFDNVPILLLQLLYESQNMKLCPILAKSIKNYSLCLHSSEAELLSLFDWMCLSYFINNSNTSWNQLHFGVFSDKKISIFTAGQTNKSLQAHKLAAVLEKPTDELIYKLLQPSLLHNIQECYCDINKGQYVPCLVLIEFLNLPQLTIFIIRMFQPTTPTIDNTYYAEKCSEIEKCIAKNSKIKQMMIQYHGIRVIRCLISVIRGVARNETMKTLQLQIHDYNIHHPPPLPDGVIEQLLKDNNTLQSLLLVIPNERLQSSLNVVEVNTPLTALEIGWSSKLTTLLLPHIKGLVDSLVLYQIEPYLPMRCGGPPHLIFLSHPNLRALILALYTAESAIELFTILQTNTTLETLAVSIMEFTSSMGTSLQDMLTQNQTLTSFEIWNDNPLSSSSCLSFLISGLRNNTSLKRLVIPIPLNEEGRAMINVISQKNNLTELDLKLRLDQSYSSCSEEEKEQIMTPLFYEQLLPTVTDMVQSHTTIKRLVLMLDQVKIIKEASQPNWKEIVQHLYETIFTHPSLECVYISAGLPSLLTDTLDNQKTLIDRLKKEQPHKQMPIVNIN